MRTPFVIAEAGSCHEESLDRAYHLIALAQACDADAVKFQFWSSPERMRYRRRVGGDDAYVRGSIKRTWLPSLCDEAHRLGLEFMCTAYLPEDIEVVAPYVDRFKVSSFEANDIDFVRSHVPYDKEIIISTGMGCNANYHNPPSGFSYLPMRRKELHCVSAYPTPLSEASLGVLEDDLEKQYAGYSDHTRCVYTGGFAVSAGADILEVHFRLDDTSPDCPDYPVALSPAELTEYIRLARLAHTMRGDGVKRPQPSEIPNMKHRVQP